jgi:hypothetical protein
VLDSTSAVKTLIQTNTSSISTNKNVYDLFKLQYDLVDKPQITTNKNDITSFSSSITTLDAKDATDSTVLMTNVLDSTTAVKTLVQTNTSSISTNKNAYDLFKLQYDLVDKPQITTNKNNVTTINTKLDTITEFFHFAVDLANGDAVYLPFSGTSEDVSITAASVASVAPYTGLVHRVSVRASANMGNTVVAFHKNEGASSSTATVTASATSIKTALTGTNTFAVGDLLHFNIDPTTVSGGDRVYVTVEVKYIP